MTVLHQLIEAQARRTPGSAAVAFEGQKLTYAELDSRADVLAARLQQRGVGPDALVGLLVERSVDTIVGILGILKAGGAYVPLDPALPRSRTEFVLRDAGVSIVLIHSPLAAGLPESVEPICLDGFAWRAPITANADVPTSDAHLAYVIYTSGSTGRPKGVCIEHRQIVNYVNGIAERLELEAGMQHATVSTIAADLGNTIVFPALATGGCVHVISRERAESQTLLSDYFSREQIDVLKIVPSHLAALQNGPHPERVMPRRRLILGGEASRPESIRQLQRLAPSCEIYNHYGPTETTVGVLTYHVGTDLPAGCPTVPLGKPLPNTRVDILDDSGNAVTAGDEGEICIAGASVGRGYLNRPDLTTQKFVSDPTSSDPAMQMYRSGDRGRRLPDGNVEFLGRLDDQIKLHGNRIEPGEIEAALRESRGVREAVVLTREIEPGEKELVAYVVPTRTTQPLWQMPSVHALPDGSQVAHLNRNETDYIYNEIFVLQAYLRHGIQIRDGDFVIDAGANIGLFTVFTSRLASNLRILAFEPNPVAFACLKANADACGADVTCLPVGLSREDKTAEMTAFSGLSLLSGFHADADTEREVVRTFVLNQQTETLSERLVDQVGALIDTRMQPTKVAAHLRTLSDVISERRIDRIDLLKINVEKSELDVLLGLAEPDWCKIRQFVIEVDTQADLKPITDLLADHGFEVLVEQDDLLKRTQLCYVYAIRSAEAGERLTRDQTPDAHLRALRPATAEILTSSSLRAWLKDRLPHYMIPSSFMLVDAIPLTPNGKIDRQALQALAPTPSASVLEREVAAPRTDTEIALAAIWRELLQVEDIGVDDDFFELGGQSLMAIRAVSRIREAFGVDVSLRNIFDQPTLAGLAETIDGLSWMSKPAPHQTGVREEIIL